MGIFWLLALNALTVAQSFFIPVFIALFVALILSPIRRKLAKLGVSASIAASLVSTVLFLLLAVLIATLASSAQTWSQDFETLIPDAIERFEEMAGAFEPVMEAGETLEDALDDMNTAEMVVIRETGILSTLAEATPRILGQVGFTLVLILFFLASGDRFYRNLVNLLPNVTSKANAKKLVKVIELRLSAYFLVVTIINACLGVAVGTAMHFLGMPDPLLFGIAAFLLNYIPFVGAVIGVCLTALIGIVSEPDLGSALFPAATYLILTFLEGQFITPLLVGRRLKLNPVIVLLAVFIGAWVWSFWGMFLAVPLLITFKVFIEEKRNLKHVDDFITTPDEDTVPDLTSRELPTSLA